MVAHFARRFELRVFRLDEAKMAAAAADRFEMVEQFLNEQLAEIVAGFQIQRRILLL